VKPRLARLLAEVAIIDIASQPEHATLLSRRPPHQHDYKRVLKRHHLPALASKRLDIIASHMALATTNQFSPMRKLLATSRNATPLAQTPNS
jgi:hypothetical protein